MKEKNKKIIYFLILIILFPFTLISCRKVFPVENKNLVLGVGIDLIQNDFGSMFSFEFIDPSLPSSSNNLSAPTLKKKNNVLNTEVSFPFQALDVTRTRSSKEWFLSTELVYLLGDDKAYYGIDDLLELFDRKATTNQKAILAVCEPSCKEIFDKADVNKSVSENIYDLVRNLNRSYFYDKDFSMLQVAISVKNSYRQLAVPVIKLDDYMHPSISGLALFNANKLYTIVPNSEALYINMLRNPKNSAQFEIGSDNLSLNTEILSTNFTKVKVSKNQDQLVYDVYVRLDSVLQSNTLIKIYPEFSEVKNIEAAFENSITQELQKEIEKMQYEYKFDYFDLTRYAVAKYGNKSDISSSKTFCNAKINPHIDVKIKTTNRKKLEK